MLSDPFTARAAVRKEKREQERELERKETKSLSVPLNYSNYWAHCQGLCVPRAQQHKFPTTRRHSYMHTHSETHIHTQNQLLKCLKTSPCASFCPLSSFPYRTYPSLSFPQLPLSARLHPQSTLLFLHSSSSPPITTDPSASFPQPLLSSTPPFLRTGLKVLFITRAGDMALKNHPIIIFHPANSTHSHRDIITTPCHTREIEAADFQPGRMCHSVCVCVCVRNCSLSACLPASLIDIKSAA